MRHEPAPETAGPPPARASTADAPVASVAPELPAELQSLLAAAAPEAPRAPPVAREKVDAVRPSRPESPSARPATSAPVERDPESLPASSAESRPAPPGMPGSMRALEPFVRADALAAFRAFFGDGHAARFKIYIDTTCGGALPGTTKVTFLEGLKCGSRVKSRGSLDYLLPWVVHYSSYAAEAAADASVAIVAFNAALSRNAVSLCRALMQRESPAWAIGAAAGAARGSRVFFIDPQDRGRCCHGGQVLDPALLAHHFIVHNGEEDGPRARWLFRELREIGRGPGDIPESNDTAPHLRCYNERLDLVMPPTAHLVQDTPDGAREERELEARAQNRTRKYLAQVQNALGARAARCERALLHSRRARALSLARARARARSLSRLARSTPSAPRARSTTCRAARSRCTSTPIPTPRWPSRGATSRCRRPSIPSWCAPPNTAS